MRLRIAVALLIGLLAVPAVAQVPDELVDQDYKNCVGGETAPDRVAFCQCVRDGMKKWTPDTYMQAVQDSSAASKQGGAGTAVPPAKVAELAKACLDQVLH